MKRSLIRIIAGYFCAVTSAALSYATWWIVAEMAEHSLGEQPLHALVEMFCLGWGYTFFAALLPFSLGLHIEFGRGIDKPIFFIAGASITGALLLLPTVHFLEGGVFDQSDASFLERCWNSLPRFAVSGAVAGCVYYFVRKFPRARESLDMKIETGA
jgi:hypothetical protein